MRVHMSNVMNTPIEVVETEYPIEILQPGAPAGERGRGRPPRRPAASRGRTGCWRTRRSRPCSSAGSSRRGAPSAAHAGAPYRVTLERDGTSRDVKGKETVRLRSGDVVLIETCGGGGYGEPAARAPELLARDRLEGYVPAGPLARRSGASGGGVR